MKRFYADTRHGQIHLRRLAARSGASAPPLICLHPIPYSGLYYATIAPMLNDRREIIAPDYPGYGGSDALPAKPSIRQYAEAMLDALDDIGVDGPVDLFGFHTGCLVAPEMSLVAGERVRRMTLIDVPYFDKAQQAAMYDKVVSSHKITADLQASLEPFWSFTITKRLDDMPLARAYELFLEQARTGDGEALGYHAAFTYPGEDLLPRITHPTLLIATRSGLLDATRNAARIIPDCSLTECLDITSSVMETGPKKIAQLTLKHLAD